MHTRHPFKIAREGASVVGRDVDRIVVRIEHDGLVGLGEAAPTPYYRQSLDSVERALERIGPMLGAEPEPIEALVDRLLERFDDQRATVAAVDAALHDWAGRRAGQSVWRMLGLDPADTPPTSMTIGIDDAGLIERKVREADAFSILKVKVGTADDAPTLSAVRRVAPQKRLRVDANCGWSPAEAAERIAEIGRFDLELIEQPLPAGCLDELRRLRECGSVRDAAIPIIADEDCVRPVDLERLAGVVDGVNIKLSKCGGIVEALRMIRQARSLGLKVMLGCMVETSLGVGAAAAIASLADYVDLDGHLLLADDPFTGLDLADGVVRPGPDAGLGIEVRREGAGGAAGV
ncbi:MAG TPA: dipeptide epimerase [Polyangia bacterium]|nr:dipeptide epimerase [Polyangia bacterium]